MVNTHNAHRRQNSQTEQSYMYGCSLLFCSLAVLDLRVGDTMDVGLLSPFILVLCHSDWLFHWESCPCLDVVHPGRAWSSSPACTWHCSLHYFFLRATPLFPRGVTIVWVLEINLWKRTLQKCYYIVLAKNFFSEKGLFHSELFLDFGSQMGWNMVLNT